MKTHRNGNRGTLVSDTERLCTVVRHGARHLDAVYIALFIPNKTGGNGMNNKTHWKGKAYVLFILHYDLKVREQNFLS